MLRLLVKATEKDGIAVNTNGKITGGEGLKVDELRCLLDKQVETVDRQLESDIWCLCGSHGWR